EFQTAHACHHPGAPRQPMITPIEMLADLRTHDTICRELLALAERESHLLRRAQTAELSQVYLARKSLLPRLAESLQKIRAHRLRWQSLTVAERQQQPEIGALVRQAQDLIMRVILLDRENEQGLLRRGLVPAREMSNLSVHQ